MDIATIIGLVLAIGAIIGSIATSGDLLVFIHLPSLLVVGFGVIGATFIKWPLEVIKKIASYAMKVIFFSPTDPKETIEEIGKLAEVARRESVFALEKVDTTDPFLKKAMILAADNRPPETIQFVLKLEIDAIEERHRIGIDVFKGIADDGPAFGMIGTLIGLIIMLGNLSDQAAIGPAMAVALLTTFYGACLANIIGNPFRNKLEKRSQMEVVRMHIIVAGALGIVAGENPRLIKEKLNSFISPGERDEDELE